MNRILANKLIFTLLALVFLYGCTYKQNEYEVRYFETNEELILAAQIKAIEINGYPSLIMPTGSMRPTIQDYDFVVITSPFKDSYDNITEGDIVRYSADWTVDKTPVLHRAVLKDNWGWIMKGDNPNNSYENKSRVTAQNYLGRLHSIYRLKTNDRSPNN
jgi:signal peptidase I